MDEKMERERTWRTILVAALIAVTVLIAAGTWTAINIYTHARGGVFSIPQIPDLFRDIADHIFAIIVVSFAVVNYRTVLRFIDRRIKPTDGQIVGTWHVYRYGRKNNDIFLMKETWEIFRDAYSHYRVATANEDTTDNINKSGQVVYNERDRFNILLTGTDHNQQSLVCFESTIPRDSDTRILGLGTGDDSRYILSTRIYLASKMRLDQSYAATILDDASHRLTNPQEECPLIQLSSQLIADVLSDHPIPPPPTSGLGGSGRDSSQSQDAVPDQ